MFLIPYTTAYVFILAIVLEMGFAAVLATRPVLERMVKLIYTLYEFLY